MTPPRRIGTLAAFAISTVVALTAWLALDADRDRRMQELGQIETDFRLRTLRRDVIVRVNAIRHIAALWRTTDPDGAVFEQEALEYMSQFPGIRAVRYVDGDFVVRYVAPSGLAPAPGAILTEIGPLRRAAAQEARATGQVTISGAVDLLDGSGRGFVAYIPILRGTEFRGLITVVFNAEAWLEDLLLDDQQAFALNFASRIEINDRLIHADPGFDTLSSRSIVSESAEFFGHSLRISTRPTERFLSSRRNVTPEIAAPLLGAFLFAAYVQFALLRRANRAEARAEAGNARLRQVNEALALEVDERRRAEAAARQSQAATSRFLTTMSHEIRTPLNAIMGMFQLIEAADIPERHRRQAAAGYASSQRLFRGLSNVLDVSRLDAGALTIVDDQTALEPLVNSWHSALEGMVIRSGKPLEARLELGDDLPEIIETDAGRVTQIVTNLLDNAVKFTRSGRITLRVHRAGSSGKDLEIQVVDTGGGIPEARRDEIFQRFYQLDNGLARQHQGSGLGLSICREIAWLMGAQLTHSNNDMVDVGSGSTFSLRLSSVAWGSQRAAKRGTALGGKSEQDHSRG